MVNILVWIPLTQLTEHIKNIPCILHIKISILKLFYSELRGYHFFQVLEFEFLVTDWYSGILTKWCCWRSADDAPTKLSSLMSHLICELDCRWVLVLGRIGFRHGRHKSKRDGCVVLCHREAVQIYTHFIHQIGHRAPHELLHIEGSLALVRLSELGPLALFLG